MEKKCETCRYWDTWSMQIEGRFKCRVGMFMTRPDDSCEFYKPRAINETIQESLDEIRESR